LGFKPVRDRSFREKVQKAYVPARQNLPAFLGQSPDKATSEDLRVFSCIRR